MAIRLAVILFLGAAWLMFMSGVVVAHGIELEVTREGTLLRGVVRESRGPALADMPVSISGSLASPPRLTGKSDAAGRFEFTVDPAAVYRVVVDDGLGHRAVATVAPTSVTADGASKSSAANAKEGLPWRAWFVGLGLIGALTACAAWVMGRWRGTR